MSLIMRYLKTRRNFAGENNTWRLYPEADTPKGGYFNRIIWLRRPSVLDIGKVCLCNTNRRLYHKAPCLGARE